jgi:hypothetical protein
MSPHGGIGCVERGNLRRQCIGDEAIENLRYPCPAHPEMPGHVCLGLELPGIEQALVVVRQPERVVAWGLRRTQSFGNRIPRVQDIGTALM